jgi:hypothetical protein
MFRSKSLPEYLLPLSSRKAKGVIIRKSKTSSLATLNQFCARNAQLALETKNKVQKVEILSAYKEKIPARNAIYAHAQDFSAGGQLILAIPKAFIPQPLNKQQTIGFNVF